MTETGSDGTRRLLPYALAALAAHVVGDFLLQPDWMVANKLDAPGVRALHVTVYTFAFAVAVLASDWSRRRAAVFLGIVWATHFAIDSRRWTDVAPVLFDQLLHALALVAAFFVAARLAERDANREASREPTDR